MITIHKLIADVLRLPEASVTGDTSMENTQEWDSLKHIEIIVAIEQQLGVELTGDEIADMISVKAIETILHRHRL
ncbi:MAG: acyl carrier protein [Alphaproteobacteria bacterium]